MADARNTAGGLDVRIPVPRVLENHSARIGRQPSNNRTAGRLRDK